MSEAELHEDEALAAEHALGVLGAHERAAAEHRMAHDPGFAGQVEAWRGRLAPLFSIIPAVEAPAGLWARIERGLPANDDGLEPRLAFWRRTAIGSMGLAIAGFASAIWLFMQPPLLVTPDPGPMLNARLDASSGAGGSPLFVAAYDPLRQTMLVASLVPPGTDPGHSHELWLIPRDGKPRALGLIPAGQSLSMVMPSDMAALTTDDAKLGISVEPPKGSPTDGPSGPMVAIGALQKI